MTAPDERDVSAATKTVDFINADRRLRELRSSLEELVEDEKIARDNRDDALERHAEDQIHSGHVTKAVEEWAFAYARCNVAEREVSQAAAARAKAEEAIQKAALDRM
ncbi:MAG: hypothetical protein OXC71_09075 [Chloroflexi bacterium]|nr:hypothetical protein [Chloroflexota bacterium]